MKKVKSSVVDITGSLILAVTVAAILFLFIAKSNEHYIANLLIR